jgi:hypothetical protein
MTDTIHEVSTKPAERGTTPLIASPETELFGRDTVGPEARVPRFSAAGIRIRSPWSFGVAIVLVSFAVGSLAMRWAMTYQGHGGRFTPVAGVLVAAVVLLFGLPEVVGVIRHRHAKARARAAVGEAVPPR